MLQAVPWPAVARSVPLPRAWTLGSGGGSGWQGGQKVPGSSAGWSGVGRAGPALERTQREARPGPGCWAEKGVGGRRRPQGRVQAGPTLELLSRRSSALCWPRTSTQTRSTRRRCSSWTAPAATASRGQCSPRTGEWPRPLGASPDVPVPRDGPLPDADPCSPCPSLRPGRQVDRGRGRLVKALMLGPHCWLLKPGL